MWRSTHRTTQGSRAPSHPAETALPPAGYVTIPGIFVMEISKIVGAPRSVQILKFKASGGSQAQAHRHQLQVTQDSHAAHAWAMQRPDCRAILLGANRSLVRCRDVSGAVGAAIERQPWLWCPLWPQNPRTPHIGQTRKSPLHIPPCIIQLTCHLITMTTCASLLSWPAQKAVRSAT